MSTAFIAPVGGKPPVATSPAEIGAAVKKTILVSVTLAGITVRNITSTFKGTAAFNKTGETSWGTELRMQGVDGSISLGSKTYGDSEWKWAGHDKVAPQLATVKLVVSRPPADGCWSTL